MTRTIRALTIWAAAALGAAGAGCGGKASQSPDGGPGGGGAGGMQAGGAGGNGMPDAGTDTLSSSDAGDGPVSTDAADAPSGTDARDAADAPSGTDARDAADAPSGADARDAADVGMPFDGGNLPGVWYELGGSGTGLGLSSGGGDSSDSSIQIDVLGHPMVAWRSAHYTFGVSLKHWTGSAWKGLGLSDHDLGVADGLSGVGAIGFTTSGGGIPTLAWTATKVQARQWQARVWETIGNSATTGGLSNGVSGDWLAMAADSAGRPVVAWRVTPASSQAASKIMLRAWDGTSWVERGGSATGNGLSGMVVVQRPSVAVDRQGRIVVAWEEGASAPSVIVRVKRWDGTAWQAIDNPRATGSVSGPRLAIDSTGRPILAWGNFTGVAATGGVYVQRWNGTAWEDLGSGSSSGTGVTAGYGSAPVLAIDEQDRIVLAWQGIYPPAGTGQTDVYARMWDGQSWNELGGSASGTGISSNPATQSDQIAVTARGNRVCMSWSEWSPHVIQMRCFDLAPKFCSCDTSAACETGCACDVNCVTPAWDDFACPAGAYRCHDGRCVAGAIPCNGVNDCADGSDESALCPNGALFDSPRGTAGCAFWVCGDGTCNGARRCDRVVDCPDGSDEDAICDVPTAFVRESIDFPAQSISGIDVKGIWSGPSGVWAGGSGGNILRRTTGGWTLQGAGGTDFTATWGSGSSLVLVVMGGSLMQWDGANWSLLNFTTSGSQSLTGLWGTGPGDIWTVGYTTSGSYPGVAWHGSSPTTWSSIDVQGASRLWAVGGSASDDVWAVGDAGAIRHWTGSAFSTTTSGTANRLRGVYADARNSAWAAGDLGTIVRWTGGTSWAPIAPITQAVLWAMWGASGSDVWAVGTGGVILHWNGTKWTNVWSGTSDDLYSIGGAGNDVWVGGPPGYVLRLTR